MNLTISDENKGFFVLLLTLALPIMVQNFLHSSLNFLDVLMIGQLKDSAIAAAGIANQLVFIFFLLQFGIQSGISIYASQYWGKKDVENVRKLIGIGLFTGFLIAIIFTFIAIVIPEYFISLFTTDEKVQELAIEYLQIVGLSFFISVFTYTYTANLRSTEIVIVPIFASSVAVVLNLFLNYLLIFGNFGFPVLGVKGAAIATCISRYVEGMIIVSITYFKDYPAAARFSDMINFDSAYLKRIYRTCFPVFLNEFFWSTGVAIYNIIYARIGTEAIAAVNIIASIEGFIMIPFLGILHAGTVIIGHKIGAGFPEDAYQFAKRLVIFQFLLSFAFGFLMISSRSFILSFYNISEIAYNNAYYLIVVAGLIFCIKITNYTFVVSIFRGGGDTRFGLFVDMGGIWLIGIPLALIGGFVLKLPVYWVMAMVVTEEIVKLLIEIPRFISRKWLKNIIE